MIKEKDFVKKIRVQRSMGKYSLFIGLSILTIITLSPLVMMFVTSIKPGGTLTKRLTSLVLIDFEKGYRTNLSDTLSVWFHSSGKNSAALPESNGHRLDIEYNLKDDEDFLISTRITQDVRRFSTLEMKLTKNGNLPACGLMFVDEENRSTGLKKFPAPVDTEKYNISLVDINKKKSDMQHIRDMIIKCSGPATGVVSLDDLVFNYKKWTLLNYYDVLISGPFKRYFFNSFWISFWVTLGNLLFSAMAGYAFAKRVFYGKKVFFMLILGSLMIPPQVTMVPMFIIMKNINWLDTFRALIIPALVSPFNIFIMRQFIMKLPASLEEAAIIDGAAPWQIFYRIILPLTKPALAVVGINTFMGSWNTFLFPFILTNTVNMRTLPVGLALFLSSRGSNWVQLMAASAITAIPVIIVFLLFQKLIISGLTAGATKE